MTDGYYDSHKEACGLANHTECSKVIQAAAEKGLRITIGTPWSEIKSAANGKV